jgi:hypothetical protein
MYKYALVTTIVPVLHATVDYIDTYYNVVYIYRVRSDHSDTYNHLQSIAICIRLISKTTIVMQIPIIIPTKLEFWV